MAFQFKYLSEIAIADAAFEAEADSWPELLRAVTEALTAVMVKTAGLRPNRKHRLVVEGDSVESLFYNWLSELIYLKDTEGFLVQSVAPSVHPGEIWRAEGVLHCDLIDRDRHELRQDVKAVTYHRFQITEHQGRYTAKIVLDI
jgi:SHS2 domain-containing protein